jgi:hypothetical protein
MLVESRRHLECRIRLAILSHQRRQLPAVMSTDRHARIINAIEQGDPHAVRAVEDRLAAWGEPADCRARGGAVGVVFNLGVVPEADVGPGDGDGHAGDDEAVLGELPKRDRVAVAGGDADHDHVGAGADRGCVSSEVCAEGE